jgi:hypothetical protein
MRIKFALLQSVYSTNEDTAVAGATSLTAAENDAVAASVASTGGYVYFNYHHDEYIISIADIQPSVGPDDTVVHLIGVNNLVPVTNGLSGILTLTDPATAGLSSTLASPSHTPTGAKTADTETIKVNQVAQLVQAMAGFGASSGPCDSLNMVAPSADTSQQSFLTMPHQHT